MTGNRNMKGGQTLPVHKTSTSPASREDILYREIECVIGRNKNERFLQALLTRARILEDLIK